MPDLIHALHRLVRPFYPELVRFTPEHWGMEGIEPNVHWQRQARWGALFSQRLFSRKYAGVPGRVYLHDNMLMNDNPVELAHYVAVGESALKNIRLALAAGGRTWADLRTVLDFPSGYGRVLRHLVRVIDPKRITACELDPEAVEFCVQEFGVRSVRSSKDLDAVQFGGPFDLIWVGSLFTHLPPPAGVKLLHRLVSELNPGGLLVFSTQGPSCLPDVENYGFMFKGYSSEFAAQFKAEGAAYADYYPHQPGYGIALYHPDRVRCIFAADLPECRELLYRERGLDNHQDVWAIQR